MTDSDYLFDLKKLPKYKVELHVHLDGAIRSSTLWELSREKGIDLKVASESELRNAFLVKEPTSIQQFLKPFRIFLPVIQGDLKAIERISYEFCEDAAKEHLLYAEVSYCPHLLLAQQENDNELTTRDVVVAVNKGLARGLKDFDVHVKSILCCLRGKPEWSKEVLDLCSEFNDRGVVGIGLLGDESGITETDKEDIAIFEGAASLGIHRTVHAGENGSAAQVGTAVRKLRCDRIAHGYRVVDDLDLYAECLRKDIHFETCPLSSILTSSVSLNKEKHPIVRFAEDNANFSINRDDPLIIQKTLEDDYEFLKGLGLKDLHFTRANFNALRSAFLPESEKEKLMEKLSIAYGIQKENQPVARL